MIKAFDRKQIIAAEKQLISSGVGSVSLMQKAAEKVAEEILKIRGGGKVLVMCGIGNNGGDGYACAQILLEKGFSVTCYKISGEMSSECLFYFKQFRGKVFENLDDLSEYDIIIDALLGTGLSKDIQGEYLNAVRFISLASGYKVAVDIPSGINANSGLIMSAAAANDKTVVLGGLKRGNLLNDALDYAGEIIVKDIGLNLQDYQGYEIYESADIAKFFPKRKRNVNKGDFGRASLIAGSFEYLGAAILSANALAALKMGSGYSNICIPKHLYKFIAGKVPECTITLISDSGGKLKFDRAALDNIISSSNSIAIGMGAGLNKNLYKIIGYILKNFKGSLLIDADGLNALSSYGTEILKEKKCKVLLSPHLKEFSRLAKKDMEKVKASGIDLAKDFAKKYGVTVLLKNAVSVITDGERSALNVKGNSGMAKGGTGDILSGIIAGLLSRGIEPYEAAVCGAYLSGGAAELAVKNSNEYSLTASEITANLAVAINALN